MASTPHTHKFRGVKGNSLILGLAFVLAALSLGVTLLAYQYVQLTRAFNGAQFAISQVELRQNRLKALVGEAVEYSKHDSSIDPLLYSVGAKHPPGSAPAAPGAGAAKAPAPAPSPAPKPSTPKPAGR